MDATLLPSCEFILPGLRTFLEFVWFFFNSGLPLNWYRLQLDCNLEQHSAWVDEDTIVCTVSSRRMLCECSELTVNLPFAWPGRRTHTHTHTDNSLTLLLRHDCGRSKEEAGQGPASRCAALHSWQQTGDGRHFRTSQKYNYVFGQQQEEDLRSVIAAGGQGRGGQSGSNHG